MKKEVVTGFINYEAQLNKEVLLGALARFKQVKKQRQLDVCVKIYYSGVEMVPFARKVKNLTKVQLNIVELEDGLFYRVPNQSTLMCFKELPFNLIDKVELWATPTQKPQVALTEEERRERYYNRINQLRRTSFCSLNEFREIFSSREKMEIIDMKTILPEEYYQTFIEKLEDEEDFELTYGYADIKAYHESGKWNINVEIIDDVQDLEQIYLMINEEVAICKSIN